MVNKTTDTTSPARGRRQWLQLPPVGTAPLIAVGVYDALSALMAVEADHRVLFVSGYAVSAAMLGEPDIGLLTPRETRDVVFAICERVNVPVLADGDTGYGDRSNVRRTVREFESAGAAGVFLEDQVWPKRCGHMDEKRVVPAAEHAGRIEAAVAARRHDEFLVVARTDAIATDGIDEAISRGRLYRRAGADVIFVEAPESVDVIRRIGEEIDAPLLLNVIQGGRTPLPDLADLGRWGYRLVLHPLLGLYATARALGSAYRAVQPGAEQPLPELLRFAEFNALVSRTTGN